MTAEPRPFQCQWPAGCPKGFNRKSDLQRHYRIHTNERPYACDYHPCKKTFIQRSALTVHRRTHTGDKPHKCPFAGCGKCFSDSSSLARHRRIHTNDKPYICKHTRCSKAFCRKTTMTKHYHKEHPSKCMTNGTDQDDDQYCSDLDHSEEEYSVHQEEDLPYSSTNDISDAQDSSQSPSQSSSDTSLTSPQIIPPNSRRELAGFAKAAYFPNLWRLPTEIAQQQLASHPHQASDQILTAGDHHSEPAPMSTDAKLVGTSTNLMDESVMPNSVDANLTHWETLSELGNHGQNYPIGYQMSDYPTYPQRQLVDQSPMQLHPVHDIILDDPSQSYISSAGNNKNFSALQIQAPRYNSISSIDLTDSMPPTPTTSVHMHYGVPSTSVPAFPSSSYIYQDEYQHYLSPEKSPTTVPNQTTFQDLNSYAFALDLFKEQKSEIDGPWSQMPGAVLGWDQQV